MTDWYELAARWTPTCGGRGEHVHCELGEKARCAIDGTTAEERAKSADSAEGDEECFTDNTTA